MLWVALIVAVLVVLAALVVVPRRAGTSRRASAGGSAGRSARDRAGDAATRTRRPGGRDHAGTGTAGPRPGTPGTRSGPSASPGAGTRRAPGGQADPRPGEIWWADVPYEDGPGHKVRPCVVLRTYRGGAEVLKITSQDRSDRADHVEIPTHTWDPDADHNSFLDLTGPVRVPVSDFEDQAGTLDARVWRQVCRLHEISPN